MAIKRIGISLVFSAAALMLTLSLMSANYRPMKKRYYGRAERASWNVKIEPFEAGKVQPGIKPVNPMQVIPDRPVASPLEQVILDIQYSVGLVNLYLLALLFFGLDVAIVGYWFYWGRRGKR